MTFSSLFGERLREERKALGISQAEAASASEVTREHWGRCERGIAVPGGEMLAKFAEAGADVLYVLTGQRASISLKIDERLLLERYRESPKPLREAALRVLLGESQSVGAATQNFHGPVSGGVAGRDIVNKGKK